ncbi:MAG: class I SAM-dependent methyltransferase [Planctomycetota bacterium]
MNREILDYLLGRGGLAKAAHLADWPLDPRDQLQDLTRLRQEHGDREGTALYELAFLRRRAAVKFRRADEMIFEREALEQASGEILGRHRASRMTAAGIRTVSDLGCGIGGDALAFASALSVHGIERDPVRADIARFNVGLHAEHELRIETGDLAALETLPSESFFYDPGRRDRTGRRIHRTSDYEPPLEWISRWLPDVRAAAVKVAPGISAREIPSGADVEWVSLDGELKEAVLWFGDGKDGAKRRATLLPRGLTFAPDGEGPLPVAKVGELVLDPDPAIRQAGLVDEIGRSFGLSRIDVDGDLLTGDHVETTAPGRVYRVAEVAEPSVKKLRRRCRELGIGRVTVGHRGVSIDPARLEQQLRGKGDRVAHVILTRRAGEACALICEVPRERG